MNALDNPFVPGAGTSPPELVGREALLEQVDAWNAAPSRLITAADVDAAGKTALRRLDEGFFRVRFDRLAPLEKSYLRAMAQIGGGPHRSGDIARLLGRATTDLGQRRETLIRKGMIWSPAHGDTAFTAPLFDAFMHRATPDWHPAQRP